MISFRSSLLITLFSLAAHVQAASVGYHTPWGKGSRLAKNEKQQTSKKPLTVPERVAKTVILFHQKVLSPTDGPRSHYRPSSSEYMKQAIERHGFMMGYLMGCDRLLRENKDRWVYKSTLYCDAEYKYDPIPK
ncbi:MAG: membrane protein insertion efficiency factor YidD [Rhabdochlamydiaceae bacterium]|nr:membrane protein insertion efficiency factor YidD [Candidatus Amphrikana amoebophyrae]